jgi:hypothetical protein
MFGKLGCPHGLWYHWKALNIDNWDFTKVNL